MNPCYLGFDFGTGGVRAALIDAQRELLWEARTDYGLGEAASWREALFDLLARIPAARRRELDAIAIAGTSATVLLCGEDNRPLHPPLPYNDARAVAEAEQLQEIAPAGHIAASATSSLAKLIWLARQPECRNARYLAHQADWLAQQLHGRPGISDYHNCLKLGYDAELLRYPEWLMGLSIAHLLPQVIAPSKTIASVTEKTSKHLGLSPACRVRAGTTDSIAAFLASGASNPGEAVTSLGSSLVLKLLSETRVEAAQYGIYSHLLGKLWLAGGASNSGGAVLKSFFDERTLENLSLQIRPELPSRLDYYPLLKPGERFPLNDPAFPPRLAPRPGNDAEFLHGMLEGMARIEAQGYRLLQSLGATPLKSVSSVGGGAKNDAWTAIRARLLRVPVTRAAHAEACYGAALLAAGGEII